MLRFYVLNVVLSVFMFPRVLNYFFPQAIDIGGTEIREMQRGEAYFCSPVQRLEY